MHNTIEKQEARSCQRTQTPPWHWDGDQPRFPVNHLAETASILEYLFGWNLVYCHAYRHTQTVLQI